MRGPSNTPPGVRNNSNGRPEEKRSHIPPASFGSLGDRFTSSNRSGVDQIPQIDLAEELRQARGYTSQDFVNTAQQRERSAMPNETDDFQECSERNDAELRTIHAIMHMATSSAPDIDQVIEETRKTPFTNRIASVRLHNIGKIKFPEYSGNSDPKAHIRAFRLSISRSHLNDDKKEAGYCRFFAEKLIGPALEWFTGLEENSIENFTQLVSAFLKQYPVFIETRATKADL
ncbi:hypothetical protein Bca4012_063273 [Brassica carinata]